MDRDDAMKRLIARGVTPVQLPWPTVVVFVLGIIAILVLA